MLEVSVTHINDPYDFYIVPKGLPKCLCDLTKKPQSDMIEGFGKTIFLYNITVLPKRCTKDRVLIYIQGLEWRR